MAYRLSRKEIEERMIESYTEEFKIIKRLGEDKGKKLIEKISFERMSLTNNDMKEMIEFNKNKNKTLLIFKPPPPQKKKKKSIEHELAFCFVWLCFQPNNKCKNEVWMLFLHSQIAQSNTLI